jgi:SOS response regulatory protein OraA/RecX
MLFSKDGETVVSGFYDVLEAFMLNAYDPETLTPDRRAAVKRAVQGVRTNVPLADMIIGLFAFATLAAKRFNAQTAPLDTLQGYAIAARSAIVIPDTGALLSLMRKRQDTAAVLSRLAEHGYSKDVVADMLEAAEQGVSLDLADTLYRKELLTGGDTLESLYKRAGASTALTAYRKADLWAVLPLERLLVLQRYGFLDSETFRRGLKALGVPSDKADLWLKSDWTFPSESMLVEAYRRGKLNKAAFLAGVKASGASPDRTALLDALLPSELDATALLRAHWRGAITASELARRLVNAGTTGELHSILEASARPILGLSDALDLYHRNEMSGSELRKRILSYGYSDDDAARTIRASYSHPSMSDKLRFATLNLSDPATVKLYGLDEGYTKELERDLQSTGIEPAEAQSYWRGHWELPDLSLAFDMYHRNIITKADVVRLIGARGVAPFWRDKLTKAAENVLTYRTLGLMYSHGILKADELPARYRLLGFTEADAQLLTELAIAQSAEAEKDLTRGDVLTLFKERQLSEKNATEMLFELGYSLEAVALLIARVKLQRNIDARAEQRKLIETRYKSGVASEDDTLAALATQGFGQDEVQYWLDLWGAQAAKGIEHLTKTELQKLVKKGILTKDDALGELIGSGYDEARATLVIETWS